MAVVKATMVAVLAMVGAGAPAGEAPGDQAPETVAFLERMVGRWSVTAEATLGPGLEPVRTESRVEARLLGGRWLVAESTGTAPGGQQVTSILTLGHDPLGKGVVGTWISSMQAHLWSYTGVLDASGTALTLDTEGPIHGDPTTTARYREIIEIEDADHFRIRSMILGPDKEWFEFSRAEYRRM